MLVVSLLQSWQWVRRGVLGAAIVPLAEYISMRYLVCSGLACSAAAVARPVPGRGPCVCPPLCACGPRPPAASPARSCRSIQRAAPAHRPPCCARQLGRPWAAGVLVAASVLVPALEPVVVVGVQTWTSSRALGAASLRPFLSRTVPRDHHRAFIR